MMNLAADYVKLDRSNRYDTHQSVCVVFSCQVDDSQADDTHDTFTAETQRERLHGIIEACSSAVIIQSLIK